MKKFLPKHLFILVHTLLFIGLTAQAQEGPGGVGDALSNPFWFAADAIEGLNNSDPVASWSNLGGDPEVAAQSTANRRPSYLINQINGLPALSFATNDYLDIADNNSLNQNGPFSSRTFSLVVRTGSDVTARQVIYEEGGTVRGLNIYIDNGELYFGGWNINNDGTDAPWGFVSTKTSITANTNYVISFRFAGNSSQTGTLEAYVNGSLVGTLNNIGRLYNHNPAVLGAQANDSYYHNGSDSANSTNFFNGLMAEFIIYNQALNQAERRLVENYLASKYDISLSANNYNNNDTAANGNFDFHSVGIARINATATSLSSNRGTGIVLLENNTLTDGDYLILSSDQIDNLDLENSSQGCSLQSRDLYRTQATWRVSKNGSFNNTTVKIDVTDFLYGFDPVNDIQLEVSTNASFSSSTTYTASGSNANIISFNNISLNDGEYVKFVLPSATMGTPLPGGVSNLATTKFWWRASSIDQANNTPVASWANEGSNNEDAEQTNAASRPQYRTNQMNAYPAVDFGNTNTYLNIPNNNDINLGGPFNERTFTMAFETGSDVSSRQVLYEEGGNTRNLHMLIDAGNLIVGGFNDSNSDGPGDNWVDKQVSTTIAANTRYVVSFVYAGGHNGSGTPNGIFRMYLNGQLINSVNGVGLIYAHSGNISIGGHTDTVKMNGTNGSGNYFSGKIAEFAIHASDLFSNSIFLLHNYLASKYDINLSANDGYAFDTPANGDFDHDLVGIYNVNQTKTDSQFGTGIIQIDNPSSLSANEFLLIAADSNDYSELNTSDLACNSNTADNQRLNTLWRVSELGDVGTVDLNLDLSNLALPANGFTTIELLISSDAAFTSPTSISANTLTCSQASFSGANFSNGDYFTFRINGLEPITWDGSQYLYGSGLNQAPGLQDSGRKFVVQAGSTANLNQDAQVGCMRIVSGANLTVANGINLSLTGNVDNQGSLNADEASLSFDGESLQVISGNQSLSAGELSINNTAGVEIANDLNLEVRIQEVLRINQGNLATNGKLVLACQFTDLSQRVAQIADLSSGSITGEIMTEQCIPAKRAFRLVTSPVTTTTSIHANWQEGANAWNNNPNPGYGTHITGTLVDQDNGFDVTPSGNPSLFLFNNASQQWAAIGNTNTNTLTAGAPLRLMVRGDRSTDITINAAAPSNTILRAKGTINAGDYTHGSDFNNSLDAFNFFGNPYPAAVDMMLVFDDINTTNLKNGYYIWDPQLNGDNGRGAFVTIDTDTGSPVPTGSQANQFLQPGQAAFVVTSNQNTTPSLQFKEAYKNVDVAQTTVFSSNNAASSLDISLFAQDAYLNQNTASDGIRIKWDVNYSSGYGTEDLPKFGNLDENLAVINGQYYTAIDRRDLPQQGESIPLFINQYRQSSYVLKFDFENLPQRELILIDHYKNKQVSIQQNGQIYAFSVDSNLPASIDANRFELQFGRTLGDISLTQADLSMYPNPVNGENLNLLLPNNLSGNLEVEVTDILGKTLLLRNLEAHENQAQVSVQSLPAGIYLVRVIHQASQSQWVQKLIKE
ncbi:LamG-like jellyroll fold domain-containing protein [uncultured Mesonia sp.]|uniref:LamG-like jellyroll fold domain-containing protein n=1 Tax=uncultured Mesonia sp. TaxID=399731 RepID=UPI00374F9053